MKQRVAAVLVVIFLVLIAIFSIKSRLNSSKLESFYVGKYADIYKICEKNIESIRLISLYDPSLIKEIKIINEVRNDIINLINSGDTKYKIQISKGLVGKTDLCAAGFVPKDSSQLSLFIENSSDKVYLYTIHYSKSEKLCSISSSNMVNNKLLIYQIGNYGNAPMSVPEFKKWRENFTKSISRNCLNKFELPAANNVDRSSLTISSTVTKE